MDEPGQPPIADGEDHVLDPRSILVERIGGWILTAVVAAVSLAGVGVFALTADNISPAFRLSLPFLWLAVALAMARHAHRWPARKYRHTSYRVDGQGIEIRRGVHWRVTINVPRSRVQHTDVSQGPIERRYGLGTLVIYTAGTDHAKVELDGLAHDVAVRIREYLLPSGDADAV